MPRSRDAKVWNEDLVLALLAREEQCRQRYSVRQYTWRDGATAIEAVRRDIYKYKSSGKIIGLPSNLSKTVEDECRAIIDGSKPILPPDYTPTNVYEQETKAKTMGSQPLSITNPYHNDPYLKRIKMRGGAYAILMAFHFSQAKTMTKAQLCASAQNYCDEEMEPNFAAGRSYGAWSSKKTLINHGLICECRTTQMGRKGHMCNGVFEYVLTDNGLLFTEALLQKFPLSGSKHRKQAACPVSASDTHSNKTSATSCLQSSSYSTSKTVMKKTKATVRAPCRKEKILTKKAANTPSSNIIDLLSDSDSDLEDIFSSSRRQLPAKKCASNDSTKIPLSKPNRTSRWSISSEDDTDDSFSFSPAKSESKKTDTMAPKSTISIPIQPIVIEDSDDDSDSNLRASPMISSNEESKKTPRAVLRSTENIPRNLPKTETSSDAKLVIVIDNRERNRNATPRAMRMELTRHLTQSSGSLHPVWPVHMQPGIVDEDQLNYADFAFLSQNKSTTERLPVCIERKRVSDLVQRSYRADHWRQLGRMRDCCNQAILLVEGNTKKTSGFSSHGGLECEIDWSPDLHSIDDEHAFYRFLGRAILSSQKLKVIQTKDEQASYRSVGAVGLIAMQIKWGGSAPRTVSSSKVEINKLYTKLKARGIPWQISRRVSEEVGSGKQLENIFELGQPSARSSILTPIIAHSCSSLVAKGEKRKLIEYGTVEGWSSAIYNAWFSKLNDPTTAIIAFEENKRLADDRAQLLSSIHQGKSTKCALSDSIMEDEATCFDMFSDLGRGRKVYIKTQTKFSTIFPDPSGSEAFYKVKTVDESPLGLLLSSIVIQTVTERFESDRMVLCVLEGSTFVQRMREIMKRRCASESLEAAQSLAKEINSECDSFLLRSQDRRVLLVRGLFPALDDAAKQAGYRPEFKVLADMILADLMLRHDLVAIHAYRLRNDLETIVREFAMAAFYYQLTPRKLRQATRLK